MVEGGGGGGPIHLEGEGGPIHLEGEGGPIHLGGEGGGDAEYVGVSYRHGSQWHLVYVYAATRNACLLKWVMSVRFHADQEVKNKVSQSLPQKQIRVW